MQQSFCKSNFYVTKLFEERVYKETSFQTLFFPQRVHTLVLPRHSRATGCPFPGAVEMSWIKKQGYKKCNRTPAISPSPYVSLPVVPSVVSTLLELPLRGPVEVCVTVLSRQIVPLHVSWGTNGRQHNDQQILRDFGGSWVTALSAASAASDSMRPKHRRNKLMKSN